MAASGSAVPRMRWPMDQARSSRDFMPSGDEQFERLEVQPRIGWRKTGGARRADAEFEGIADFCRLRAPGAIVRDQRRSDHSEVAVAVAEFDRHRVDEIGRGIVGDEMAHELGRDVPRRRRMAGEIVERRTP